MRVVIDTNVLISAALFDGSVPGHVVRRTLRVGVLLQSMETLHELADVLRRVKFDRYTSQEEREEFLKTLILRSELTDVSTILSICRDPKDNKFLELALDGNADYVVTGDDDLLALHPFRGIEILGPNSFLERAGL